MLTRQAEPPYSEVEALRIVAYNMAPVVAFIRRLRQQPTKCKEFVDGIYAGRDEAEGLGYDPCPGTGSACCRRKVVLLAERLAIEVDSLPA